MSGWWSPVEPLNLKRLRHQRPSWFCAIYHELPHDRDDGQYYEAFLFRNSERTVFGIKEYLGDAQIPHGRHYRQMATRINSDAAFRDSLVSDDPTLPELWKRR